MQLPSPERSHLPVFPLQGSPLSPPGPPAPGSLTQLFPPPPVANTCSGSGRTAESGHLLAGSRVPAARLPGGGARGCCPRRRRRRRPGASWSSSVRGRLPGAPERALCAPRWCSPPAGFRLPFAFCCSSQSSLGGPWGLPLGLERGPRFYCMPSLPLHLDSGPPQRHCHPPGQFRKEMKPKGHPPEVSVHPVCGSAGWGA